MIKPIIAYGNPVLRKVATDIDKDYPEVQELIKTMFDTMYASDGVGLAAPQIGLPIRLFVIDANSFVEDYPEAKCFKKVFINAQILEESGKEWLFNEGCLSFPGIHEDVSRKSNVKMHYLDENFEEHVETFSGVCARVVQHEYDHLDGKCFIDRLGALQRRLLQRRLTNISEGKVRTGYKMKFFKK